MELSIRRPVLVKESSQSTLVVRQDRVEINGENCYIRFFEVSFKVLDYSPFGLAVIHNRPVGLNLDLKDVPFLHEDIQIAKLHIVKVREEKIGEGQYKIAFEIVDEPIPVEKVEAVRMAHRALHLIERFDSSKEIPHPFKLMVCEFKCWIENLEKTVNAIEREIPDCLSKQERESSEDTIAQIVGEYLHRTMPSKYDALIQVLEHQNKEMTQRAVQFFRDQIKELIYQDPFHEKSFKKPRGYPGDFDMMRTVYWNSALGNSLFAKCLHRYIIDGPAARAVRNRSIFLSKKIEETVMNVSKERVKILSVASGPAKEMELFIDQSRKTLKKECEFHLLDQDLDSLKYAQKRLRTVENGHQHLVTYRFFNTNIKEVIMNGLEDSGYDLIYTAGLFDYFSDSVAKRAAQILFESLEKGGKLIIGNFTIPNPTRSTMELALDWYLIYRTEENLKALFDFLGGSISFEKEKEGINLFCVITR